MARTSPRVLVRCAAATVFVLVAALVLPTAGPAQTAPAKPEAPPSGYAGAEACKGCHEDSFNKFAQTQMGRLFLKHPRNSREALACESCHGPGKQHVDAGGGKGAGGLITFAKDDPTPVEKRNEICLSCHTKGARIFWTSSAHDSRDIACTSCHQVMENISSKSQLRRETEVETCGTCHVDKRAASYRFSRHPILEGKITCSSCHNPHGTVSQALLRDNSINETCYNCHADKRGPFLWEHAPVVESCTNCHDPHGTNHEKMLKVAKPRLCQQCHIESRHPTSPYGYNIGSARYTFGRSCVNCHSVIHGSNHPSGAGFTR
jgi:DmsE family decaheme c-type cytochrome